jgi:carbamoyltransferase
VEEGPFDDIWIQPASGDDGGALGAALWGWYGINGGSRQPASDDSMSGALLGPRFDHSEIAAWLRSAGVTFEEHRSEGSLESHVAEVLCQGAVVGWFQGRMEYGPRALGNRSILADPRRGDLVDRINRMVKQREGFRPFAPAVLAEDASEWFDLSAPRPYMLVTAQVASQRRTPHERAAGEGFAELLAQTRSEIPACTHVDGTARVQTVERDVNPRFHRLIQAFRDRTGCPVLLNTSFNGRNEPIVRSPADALRCFESTGLDLLVMEGCVVERSALAAAVAA